MNSPQPITTPIRRLSLDTLAECRLQVKPDKTPQEQARLRELQQAASQKQAGEEAELRSEGRIHFNTRLQRHE